MRALLLSLFLLSITQSAFAGRIHYSCEGLEYEGKLSVHGSVDIGSRIAKTMVVHWVKNPTAKTAPASRMWIIPGKELGFSSWPGQKIPSWGNRANIDNPTKDEPYVVVAPIGEMKNQSDEWLVMIKTGPAGIYAFNDDLIKGLRKASQVTCKIKDLKSGLEIQEYDLCYDHFQGCMAFVERNKRVPKLADRDEVIWGIDSN